MKNEIKKNATGEYNERCHRNMLFKKPPRTSNNYNSPAL